MKKLMFLLACSFVLISVSVAHAGTSDTDSDSQSAKKAKSTSTKSGTGDIDEEITNARMRAETGAKSDWSFASFFNYAGAAITNPLSSARPQLNEGQASADPTNLTGQLSIKYRVTQHDNLNLGFGVQYTPAFTNNQGVAQSAATTASSPYLTYSRVFKSGAIQNNLSISVTKYTLATDTGSGPGESNDDGQLALSHEMMAELGKSGFSIGGYTFATQEFYNPGATPPAAFTRYQFGFEPVLEYAFSDKISLRTVSRWLIYTVPTGSSEGQLARQTESLGLGYTITRDLWIYPNIQWMWSRMNPNLTTVGFSTYINL